MNLDQFARWQSAVDSTGGDLVERLLQALVGQPLDRPPGHLILLHCPECARTTIPTSRGERSADPILLEAARCDSVVEGSDLRRRRTIPQRLRREALRRARYRCEAKDCNHTRWLEVHHRRPVSGGGGDRLDNLVVLCRRCHLRLHQRESGLRDALGAAPPPVAPP